MYWNPEVECAPREEIERRQFESLRGLVANLYDNNPFYRGKMDGHGVKPGDIRCLEDISKLPFMYKDDLRDNYPTKLFTVPTTDIVRYHVSSGTTGKPTLVGYTREDLEYWTESLARALTSVGITDEDTIQVSYGYGLFTGGLGLHYGAERVGASVLPSSTGSTERQLELMVDLGVTAIACTPSYLIHMIEVAGKMGIDFRRDTKLRIAVLGAEPWTDAMRKIIEESAGIRAYDIFGTSEMAGPMFTECGEQDGIHLSWDMVYPEIIDPETGEVLGPGEEGELVVTMLKKEALPMVRFRLRDVTAIIEGPCKCGRTSPRIRRITGRTDDMLIVRGINVFPSQVEHALLQVPELTGHYQITVDRIGALDVMKVEAEIDPDAFSDKMEDLMSIKKRAEGIMKKYLNIGVRIELREHGSLPRYEGKGSRVKDMRSMK
ncbi:MAG: phenylacetate--CoA ligase [Thermoplasmatales archaeon]|nr:phenylacetate--CoA ligase [Thermoplasmatales archaeon]